MVDNVDKMLKEKYENITTSEYNKQDIEILVKSAKSVKLKNLLIKVYSLIFGIIVISFVLINNINFNVQSKNYADITLNDVVKSIVENNILSYGKILPKETETTTFSGTAMNAGGFDWEYKKYDYAFIVEAKKELDYTYIDEIDEFPKTLFEVKVIEKLKGDLGDVIKVYSNGGMAISSEVEGSTNNSNTYTKYIPFNYMRIGNRYLVGIKKIGDKLYVDDIRRYDK